MVTRSVTRSVNQPVAIPFALAGRSMLRLPYRGASLSLAFDSQQYAMGAIGKRPAAFAFSDLITFTRASGGGRFNAQGQYEWLPANTPRIDYDPVTGECRGLLVEEQRTNLLRYSSDAQVTQWSKSALSVAVATIISPSGTASAKKLIPGQGLTYTNINMSGATSVSGAYCLSVYAQAAEISTLYLSVTNTSTIGVSFDLSAKTAAVVGSGPVGNIEDVGGGWFRCSVTLTLSAQNAHALIQPRPSGSPGVAGDGTSGIYIWGAQLEQGSSPSSYIPTTDAQVTRAGDIATVNELSPWYNPEQGTLYFKGDSRFFLGPGQTSVCLSQAGWSGLRLYRQSITQLNAIWNTLDGQGDSIVGVTSNLGEFTHATSYSSSGISTSANGGTPTVLQANRTGFVPSLLRIGSYNNSHYFNGHIRSIRYYPRRLSNTELQALTA